MNVKLLRKIKKHILEEPKRLEMGTYISRRGQESIGREYAKCGTAACIAGWACVLEIGKGAYDLGPATHYKATQLLEITDEQAERLFLPCDWPGKFVDGLNDDGKPSTAKVAAARIELFIKTKGAK